jgi:acyl dehydratase
MTAATWVDDLQRDVAGHAGTGDWLRITQELVDRFDLLTGHPHWLHLDKERAKSESPFGAPVAPAFLTLSLLPLLFPGNRIERGNRLALNYGFDRVRFTAPVLVGDDIRLCVRSGNVTRQGSGAEIAYDVVVEAKSTGTVVLSAQWIVKVYQRRASDVGVLQA